MDSNSLINIIIAIVSSSALTAFINYISNFSKNRAEAIKLEQDVVSDKIDQASVIVNTAMKLLEDVQDERNRLSAERDNLIKINIKLTEDIEKIKLNINKFNTSWENDN
jgi:hypothetical protein